MRQQHQRQPRVMSFARPVAKVKTGLEIFLLVIALLVFATAAKVSHATTLASLSSVTHSTAAAVGYNKVVERQLYLKANQAYDDGEIYLAQRMWLGLAEQGHGDAAFKVGMLYDRGETVAPDPKQAASWYARAAKSGNVYAQHNLGVAYANGDGVEANIITAVEWWLKAAEHGNVDSQYNLGIVYAMGTQGYARDITKAAQWWRRAALKGDAMAQYNLGALYANGDKNLRNVCEAMHWLQQSASRGVTQANEVLETIKVQQESSRCH
jgi:uncharacterized protein